MVIHKQFPTNPIEKDKLFESTCEKFIETDPLRLRAVVVAKGHELMI